MKKNNPLILLCLLLVFLTGCDAFPYVIEVMTRTPVLESTAINEPTATLEAYPGEATVTPEPVSPVPTEEIPTELVPAEPQPSALFITQPGNPIYLPNFSDPDAGCNWMGVAGQVFGQEWVELQGLTVMVGTDPGEDISLLSTITGLAPAYGPGGYEIVLGDRPLESSEMFWVQIIDVDGSPLTEKIYFETFQDCERNLVLMNFVAQGEHLEISPDQVPISEAYP